MSKAGNGIEGQSSFGFGVYGSAYGLAGVRGQSALADGVFGSSNESTGVHGESVGRTGVFGNHVSPDGVAAGVEGDTASTSDLAVGVLGKVSPSNAGRIRLGCVGSTMAEPVGMACTGRRMGRAGACSGTRRAGSAFSVLAQT